MTEKMTDKETINDSMINTEEPSESQPELLSMERLPVSIQEELKRIFSGQDLPQLYSDIIAKTIFNVDIHPERYNFLMGSIAKDDTVDVERSAANEAIRQSLYSKSFSYDLPGWLFDGRLSNMEVQNQGQNFVFTRTDLYGAELLILQYQVNPGQKKSELDYTDVNDVLLVVLMVHSPKPFKEYDKVSDRYIHRFTQMVADTGLTYERKVKTMYVQLDKCLEQFQRGYNAETEDHQPDTLQLWLSMIADVNDENVSKAAEQDPDLQSIRSEAMAMAQDREVQNMIIQDRYNRMDWVTYGNQREEAGGIRMLVNLVKNGTITVEQAAKNANMSVEEFTKEYLTPASA